MQIVDCGYFKVRCNWKSIAEASGDAGVSYRWKASGHSYMEIIDAQDYIYINAIQQDSALRSNPGTDGRTAYSYHSYPFISFIDDRASVTSSTLILNVVEKASKSGNEKISVRMMSVDPRDISLDDGPTYIDSLCLQDERIDIPQGTFGTTGSKSIDITRLHNYMLANPTETSRENAGNSFHTLIINPSGIGTSISNTWLIQIATKIDYANGGVIFDGQTSPFNIQPIGSLSTGIYIGGQPKSIDSAYIRKNHAWHEVEEMYVRVGGEWRK